MISPKYGGRLADGGDEAIFILAAGGEGVMPRLIEAATDALRFVAGLIVGEQCSSKELSRSRRRSAGRRVAFEGIESTIEDDRTRVLSCVDDEFET